MPSAHLAAMDESAMRVQNGVANLALSNGPVASKAFQEGIDAADAAVDRELAAYRRTVTTTKQRQLLDRFTLADGLVRGRRPAAPATVDNGAGQVPSILLDPVAVTRDTIASTVVKDGFVTPGALCAGAYAEACKAAGIG